MRSISSTLNAQGAQTIARTMLLNFAGKQLHALGEWFADVCFILRILSAGDCCRDRSEEVRSGSHEPNV